MQSKKIIFYCSLILIVISCCKDDPPVSSNPPIGSWEVYQVDSSYIVPVVNDTLWTLIESIPTSGFIHFYEDSTGSFEFPDRFRCGVDHFSWSLNHSNDTISFSHSTGQFLGIIISMNKDSLEFRKGTCTGPPGSGYALSYFIMSTKVK